MRDNITLKNRVSISSITRKSVNHMKLKCIYLFICFFYTIMLLFLFPKNQPNINKISYIAYNIIIHNL